ncbi:hypothetical protein C8R43DRAFT_1095956, partial [Mycena crocata]
MEATFDNKTNVLNARIRAVHDNSVIYTLRTNFGFRGRKDTLLCDENPAPGATSTEKTLEIFGHKKSCFELKKKSRRFFNRTRHWRWAPDRKEYEILYEQEEWKATLDHNMSVAGRFLSAFPSTPVQQVAAGASAPTKTALAEDEVFLILVFIYCEARRQDKTVGGYCLFLSRLTSSMCRTAPVEMSEAGNVLDSDFGSSRQFP